MPDIQSIERIISIEFSDIVEGTEIVHNKLRIFLKENSFVDIWFSEKIKGRYAYHWDRRNIDDKFYRYDNIPHKKWRSIKTYPHHFHNGSSRKEDTKESDISNDIAGVRRFFSFIKKKIEID
ncbi:MAG: hypothetical protein HZA77_13365 [Candidatus Schekmanbacteria bacterium]|nr:hypothetical protein [Candidatus Schekmanbacteria bacterium]